MDDALWNLAMIITLLVIGGVISITVGLLVAGALMAMEDDA